MYVLMNLHLHIEVVAQSDPTLEGEEGEECDKGEHDIVKLEVSRFSDPYSRHGDGDPWLTDYDVKGGVDGHVELANAVLLKGNDTHYTYRTCLQNMSYANVHT